MENTYQDLITDIQSKNPKISGKLEGGRKFKIKSDFKPAGDQPEAIKNLVKGAKKNQFNQVLLGVTGSGKTFTMAKVIEETNRPALILAPNKTLAAQLYGEMKGFFPDNAVEYFVSYYDYYTPEAYVPRSDTYIEKEASINEQIDRMRHSATRSLLERDDVLIVASVSCIYGLGSVEAYSKMTLTLQKNYDYNREQIIKSLVALQYKRNDQNFYRGTFRARGEYLEVFPSHLEDRAKKIHTIREDNEAFQLKDGRTIHLLARGRLVNLAAAEGHPSEVMDMSFANQFLALCRLAAEGEGYDNIVYDISAEQDSELARLKLTAEGISIDSLTDEQLAYLEDYSAGT